MNFYFFIFMAILLVTKGNASMMCTKDSELASSNFKNSFESEIKKLSNELTSDEEKYERVKQSLASNLDSVCMTDTFCRNVCYLAWSLCPKIEGEVKRVTFVYDTNAEVNVDNNNQNLDQEVNFDSNDETVDKYIQHLSVVGCTITLSSNYTFNFYITYFNSATHPEKFYMYYFERSDNKLKFENVQLHAYRVILQDEINDVYKYVFDNADTAANAAYASNVDK